MNLLVAYLVADAKDEYSPSANWAQGGPLIDKLIIGFDFPVTDSGPSVQKADYQAFLRLKVLGACPSVDGFDSAIDAAKVAKGGAS